MPDTAPTDDAPQNFAADPELKRRVNAAMYEGEPESPADAAVRLAERLEDTVSVADVGIVDMDLIRDAAAALRRQADRIGELTRERDRANYLLRNCEMTLQLCWRDLRQWIQFGRYNAEGIIVGEPGPIPEPPQRPTVAGVNYTDQNVTVVEEVLSFIHKHLGTASEDDPLPEDLHRRIFEWLKSNQITEPHKYRWGPFPLGMVQRWIERAEKSEADAQRLTAGRVPEAVKAAAEYFSEYGWTDPHEEEDDDEDQDEFDRHIATLARYILSLTPTP